MRKTPTDLRKAKAIAVADHVIQSAERFVVNASQIGKLYRKRILQPKNRAPKRRIEKLKASVKLYTSYYSDSIRLAMLMSQPVPKATFLSGGLAAGRTAIVNECVKNNNVEGHLKPAFSFTANLAQSTVDQLRTMNQPKEKKDANLYMVDTENTVWGPFSIPGEQYEQIKRLADSQEEGTNEPE